MIGKAVMLGVALALQACGALGTAATVASATFTLGKDALSGFDMGFEARKDAACRKGADRAKTLEEGAAAKAACDKMPADLTEWVVDKFEPAAGTAASLRDAEGGAAKAASGP